MKRIVVISAILLAGILFSINVYTQDSGLDDLFKRLERPVGQKSKTVKPVKPSAVRTEQDKLDNPADKSVIHIEKKTTTAITVEKIPGMVYIPPGEFLMGINDGFDYEFPRHQVYLEGYYIDKYEVTNVQYKRFIISTEHKPPPHWKGINYPQGQDYSPVTNISYYEAAEYAEWSGKRLPTEQEWEKAARYTDGRIYPWGDEWNKKYANVKPLIGFGEPKPVGSYIEGMSPFGVYDMSGNVWEWTDGWFQLYPGNVNKNPNYGEIYKVIRGGSYRQSETMAQVPRRDFMEPRTKRIDVGFRCAK